MSIEAEQFGYQPLAPMHARLVIDVPEMILHRLLSDKQPIGNLPVW